MVKFVSILGSTGAIGRQSLDVISRMPEIQVVALTAGTSVELMAQQCREFRPKLAVMATEEAMLALSELVKDLDLRGVLKRLNDSLEHELDSTDLLIGHAYFIDATIDEFAEKLKKKYCLPRLKLLSYGLGSAKPVTSE